MLSHKLHDPIEWVHEPMLLFLWGPRAKRFASAAAFCSPARPRSRPVALKRHAEPREVRLELVQEAAGVTQVYISGGQLPDESVWSPNIDVVRDKADTMFIKLNRQSKKLRELCGTTLTWVEVVGRCARYA